MDEGVDGTILLLNDTPLRGFGAAPFRALWFTSPLQLVVHPLGWELYGGWCLMAPLTNFASQSFEY